MKNIMMFGCGRWPDESHLPAIAADQDIELTKVVEVEERAVRQRLQKHGLAPEIVVVEPGQDISGICCQGIDGVIVASPDAYHKEHTQYALRRKLPVLVDKPLTMPSDPDFFTVPGSSNKLLDDYRELIALAGDTLFMLGAHRRYQRANQVTADLIRKFHHRNDHHYIHNVTVVTADGYWILPRFLDVAYPIGAGGKLTHTGYHLLDLVPWFIRQSGLAADTAEVYAMPHTPRDSAYLAGADGSYRNYPDVNINLMVGFSHNGYHVCTFSLAALHEGFSERRTFKGVDREGRTKIEEIIISQGASRGYILRRFAKFKDDDSSACGANAHQTLDVIGPRLTTVDLGYDPGNTGPSQDFFRALKSGKHDVSSAASDHLTGISLLAAAYECMIKRINGDYSPVFIEIKAS